MSDQAIETLLEEDRRYPPPAEFAAQANAKPEIYDVPFEEFWEREGRERVTWFEPFTSLLEWELPYAKWYGGGKLNVTYNCLDRHVEAGLGDRVAFYYEGEPVDERAAITYAQLLDEVVRAANGLEGARRREGDAGRDLHGHGARTAGRDARVRAPRRAAHRRLRRVLGRGARRPAERHAVRGPAHAGRELPPRDDRPAQAERRRGARVVPRRAHGRRRPADARRRPDDGAAATSPGTSSSTGQSTDPASCPCEPMDAEDLLYLLYTSGTTAKPKGIAHTTAGYLVGVATTHHYVFDLKPETDVYWCAADIGWVTGHSYIVYGPLCNGATSVLYEGTPDFPDKDRWWDIVERYRRDDPVHGADGDPRAHEVGAGARGEARPLVAPPARVGRRADQPRGVDVVPGAHRRSTGIPIVDTWWQTETGMIMITPLPGVTTTKPGSATKPFPGVEAAVVDDHGNEVGPGGGGYLVLKRPWPAMTRGIFGDDARFRATYWERFPGMYFAGDGARVDEDGDFWLLGRVDDVMNVSGHRISTIEVESALVDHPSVAEAAVCGRADPLTGQAIVAFVTLRAGRRARSSGSRSFATTSPMKIGPIAKPANIVFTPELPKTRSGKIMRRLLRDVAEERPLGRHDHARGSRGRRRRSPTARSPSRPRSKLLRPIGADAPEVPLRIADHVLARAVVGVVRARARPRHPARRRARSARRCRRRR